MCLPACRRSFAPGAVTCTPGLGAAQQVLQEDAVGVEVQRGFAALAAQGEGFDGEVVAVAAQLRVKDGVFQR